MRDEERQLLGSLRGQDVFILFSPWMDASFHKFECGPLSFALRRSSGFLILDTEWQEDADLNDFGWMTVNTSQRAKDVRYTEEGNPFCASTIALTRSSPIARISVFRKRISPDWEFDYALLFEHEERFRYVISYEPGPHQRLVVSFTEQSIKNVLEGLSGQVL